MSAPIAVQIIWEGIAIEIIHRNRCHRDPDFDHIELHVEEGRIVPITETGYKSHFLPSGIVQDHGGPERFVRAWLDHEAQGREWKSRKEAARQMSLF